MLFIIQDDDAHLVEQNIVDLWETRSDLLEADHEDNQELIQLLEIGVGSYNVYTKIGMQRAAAEVNDYNNKIRATLGKRCQPRATEDDQNAP